MNTAVLSLLLPRLVLLMVPLVFRLQLVDGSLPCEVCLFQSRCGRRPAVCPPLCLRAGQDLCASSDVILHLFDLFKSPYQGGPMETGPEKAAFIFR